MDFEKIYMLLTVIEKAAAHGPAFGHIIAEARAQLKQIQAEHAEHTAESQTEDPADAA